MSFFYPIKRVDLAAREIAQRTGVEQVVHASGSALGGTSLRRVASKGRALRIP